MAPVQLCLLLLLAAASGGSSSVVVPALDDGGLALEAALHRAAAAPDTTVELGAGTHRISQPIQIPSGVSLRGNGAATISGGITIEHWAPVQGTPWLFEAALPAELQDRRVSQLWVGSQRRGAARSPTMVFANVTATGLLAAPGQLHPSYANASDMLCLTYQHWTAAVRQVRAVDAATGAIALDAQPAPMTGDANSGSRYYLYNAPEYLSSGSGTFYATGIKIRYAPLASELSSFKAGPEVVAARPGLFELVMNNHTTDVTLEGVTFAHTDVDYATCFAGTCALQSATWTVTASVHFEFSSNVRLSNVTIEHAGGYGLWFGPGTRNASFHGTRSPHFASAPLGFRLTRACPCVGTGGRIVDLAAGGARVGEAIGLEPVAASARTARDCTVADSVIEDGGHIFLAGMGVLVQAAANTTITHCDVSTFRQTGISVGWTWNYGCGAARRPRTTQLPTLRRCVPCNDLTPCLCVCLQAGQPQMATTQSRSTKSRRLVSLVHTHREIGCMSMSMYSVHSSTSSQQLLCCV
jgi:hypothetical protein